MLVNPDDSRSRTVFSSPQRSGGANPGGGGTCLAVVRNISPVKLAGSQLAMATRPPGFSTRVISEATSSGRGANIAPNMEITTLEGTVFVGQRFGIAFIELRREILRCGAGARLFEKIGGDIQARNLAPPRAIGMARLPEPQAISSARTPRGSLRAATKASAARSVFRATSPKSPAIHVARMEFLI